MDLRQSMERFYVGMVVNELRLANGAISQGITHNSLLYLDLIAYTDKCTVSRLADMLHIAKSAVTLKVKELERLGLVTKTQSDEDKRVFYLSVNEPVRAEYRAYDRALYAALDEVERRYSPEEVAMLCDMLESIHRSFCQLSQLEKGEL